MTTQTLAGNDPNDTAARYAIIRAGLTVLADDHVMAALERLPYASIKRLCSGPNPNRVGLLDVYVARLKPLRISMADYQDMAECSMGFCLDCSDWTTETVEPDAEYLPCETCDAEAVVGAEEALVMGVLDVQDDE